MPRFFAPALVALGALAFAAPLHAADADNAPEQILPPTTQLYVRWDGVTAHNELYKKSVWGPVMAGPTGDNIRTLIAKAPKLLAGSVLADPLLEGKSPQELKATLADLKAAEKLVDLLADKGIILAAEVREPAPSIRGIGSALGGLFGGKGPGAEAVLPDVQLLVVVPDAGDKAEVLNGSLRLLAKRLDMKVEAFAAAGRKGFQLDLQKEDGERVLPLPVPVKLSAAWWVEGKHFVLYVGTRKPGGVVAEFTANAAKGGITKHPLYQRCLKTGEFTSVTRGFADVAEAVGAVRSSLAPLVPGLKERLDGVGLTSVKSVVFASGFEGKESRALYEIDT
ncbi:MAG: hypothetical protein K2V38_06470, partial [Gemmataceae bacterium]|nr:hypothetical protein [Gemmataceae bacterium]